MPQDTEAGRHFARDMRRIREARNLSVVDLHDETKIPTGLIETFEENALFDHPQFNRVYLRSFVRTYAQVVGIDADLALEALEEALENRYAGSLAVEYLGEEPRVIEHEVEAEAASSEEDEEGTRPSDEVTATSGMGAGPARGPSGGQEDILETESTARAVAGPPAESGVPSERDRGGADWTAQSPPSAYRRSGRSSRAAPTYAARRLDRRWVITGIAFLALAVIAWILVRVSSGPSPEASQPVAVEDTSQAIDTAAAPVSTRPSINVPPLGDTLHVLIIAATEPVDPIRVTADDDLRRPYWIELGDSMTFGPTERIVIEEHLDAITLKVEGIDYPTDRRDEQGRIVITRDSIEAYFASLQGGV